jgi:hypothetical protein
VPGNREGARSFSRRRTLSRAGYASVGQHIIESTGGIVMRPSAQAVSARVETLIARYHAGDPDAAAARIGIAPERLSGLLSGDWRLFTLDALAAVAWQHSVSITWLLGLAGPDEARVGTGSATTRVEVDACR